MSRLLRQLLTESLVLAAAGAAGGVLLALWARDVIVRLTPANVPRLADVSINTRVLGFALGLTIVTALAFGARDLPGLAEFARQVFRSKQMAPRAFVVTGVVYFGMARLFATVASGWVQISVFDSKASAEAWLLQFLVH